MRVYRSSGRVVCLLLAGCAGISLAESNASHLYRLGQKAEREGHIAQAYLDYTQAAAADPKKAIYRQRADALQPMATMEAKVQPPELPDAAVAIPQDAKSEPAFDPRAPDLHETEALLPPVRLQLDAANQDFNLEGDSKALFESAASKLGLQVVFDTDFTSGKRVKIQLLQVSPRQLLHDLEAATNSFVTPLSTRSFLVAQDTDPKRRQYEPVEAITVPVPSILTTQELTELGQAIKQSVGVEKIYWDPLTNTIVLRDRVARAAAAQAVLNQLIGYRSQVAIELEFLEVDDTDMIDIGVDLQTSFPFSFLVKSGSGANLITLAKLAKFSAGAMFGVGLSDMDVTAMMSKSRAKNLLKTTMVSSEGQKATLHIGSKYPILTSQYLGSGAVTSGSTFTPTPSFTFEDLGIVVTATPHVHDMGEVTLDLDTEFKVLGSGTVENIPIISSRKFTSVMRLKANESALVAGLISTSATRTTTGPALFSRIPYLGNLISHFKRNQSKTYILMMLKPRIMSLPPNQRVNRAIYVGSETRDITPI